MSLAAKLAQGSTELGLNLPREAMQRLIDYVALLQKWNRAYNLTAVRETPRMVSHHLLDCLAIIPYVGAKTIVDVGSGAGLPGIPLAIALPQAQVTLVDSAHKKAAFLKQAVIELHLKNADVVCERVERWTPPKRFDVVVSRALSDLAEFVALGARLCKADGVMAAMKGVYPHEELALLPQGFAVQRIIPLKVPGVRAERHLVLVRPA
ncbi:MAG: 16S rRNA (guanine(527)-N(7))-methyltransferase RsmG [Betaproteobacteria bacterium]|nr:16S rRNA (guanine(527)-N(7))-methyltransferase RsmG [Betaproteobacteria bacterium]